MLGPKPTCNGSARGPEASAVQSSTPGLSSPLLGTALGVNFALGSFVSLGPELRVLLLPFPDQTFAGSGGTGSALYGSVTVVSLGLALSGHIPLR